VKYIFSFITVLIFLGCGGDSDDPVSGVHFQGRDCLSCHNVDLGLSSHLSIGGTVYRGANVNPDDLFQTCNSPVYLQILNGATVVYDTQTANRTDAPGFNGKSNLFALINDMPIGTGAYTMRIVSSAGTTLAQSSTLHNLTTGFNPADPSDLNNRYSCNTCHQAPPNNKNGASGLLFVQSNIADCVAN